MHGTIVCGVADAAEGRAAAQLASALAARLGLRLVLVHVVTHPQDDGQGALETLARELGEAAEIRVVAGNRVDGLAQVSADEGADAIVLGSRPRGARGRQLRCTLARELEAATAVPVLIAPPSTRERSGQRLALAAAASGR